MILLASVVSILNIVKSVLGIGGIIFVHELGHFLVGRWCGVRAEAFSIGFGPVIAKWKPGETEYRLSAIPLGGYVKFLGENPDERGERDPRSFHAATYPRKVAIMLAGVTMNVIAAFVLFAVTFSIGWESEAPVVGSVQPGMTAWEYGLQPGDELLRINGHDIVDFKDVPQETILADEIDVVLRRNDQTANLRLPTRDGGEGLRQIGVHPADDGRVHEVTEAAAANGFRVGDRVIAVDGVPVASLTAAADLHRKAKKDTVWTVERGTEKVDVTLPRKTKPTPRIGVLLGSRRLAVKQGGPAYAAGLRTGDEPVRVGDLPTPVSSAALKALADDSNKGPLVVRRDGREISVEVPQDASRAAFRDSLATLDQPGEVWAAVAAGDVPARRAGLADAVHIVEVDGNAVRTSSKVLETVQADAAAARAVTLVTLDLDGRRSSHEIRPEPIEDEDADVEIGLTPGSLRVLVKRSNPLDAMALGLDRTRRWVGRIVDTLGAIVTGRLSGSKLSGPVMIAKGTYMQAETSWGDFFLFLGMISMNLAVLNVLPVPLLDGGQLAVHTIERLRGKPIPERVLAGVQWAGLALLLALMVYVIRNDILNLLA